MENNEQEQLLDKAVAVLREMPETKFFVEFLEAFKSAEETHIRAALNPEDPKDFNLRSANLCAEAHATASLMVNLLSEESH